MDVRGWRFAVGCDLPNSQRNNRPEGHRFEDDPCLERMMVQGKYAVGEYRNAPKKSRGEGFQKKMTPTRFSETAGNGRRNGLLLK